MRPLRLCPTCGYNLTKLNEGDPCPGCAENNKRGKTPANGRSDAKISLTLAVLSIPVVIFWGVFTVVLSSGAIYFGRRAAKRCKRDVHDDVTPKIAATGIIIGIIMLTIGICVTIAMIFVFGYIFTAS